LLLALALFASWPPPTTAAGAGRGPRTAGALELDVTSQFSHIRVRRQGNIRLLLFVRDSGAEVVESELNLKRPQEMLAPYTHFMFSSYLLRPQQERVLIVGLGGGAMVHFLKYHDPQLQVDAVEIDPAVVQIAERYFDVRSGENLHVVTGDAFEYLDTTEQRYDVIYIDAFLKPAPDTDATGVPLRLKSARFYQNMQAKLKAEGLVVFNLNRHQSVESDIQGIRNAFAQVYLFRVPEANVVVVGSTAAAREPVAVLRARAKEADHRFKANFSFQETCNGLVR
jgi:spermidine synthase